jgi:hypothetical protein
MIIQFTFISSVAELHNFDAVLDPAPGTQNDTPPAPTSFPWLLYCKIQTMYIFKQILRQQKNLRLWLHNAVYICQNLQDQAHLEMRIS